MLNDPATQHLTSKVTYLYRDASNYKFWGDFFLSGSIARSDFEMHLFDTEFFIPEVIGIQSLCPKEFGEDDHFLHTIEDIELIYYEYARPTDIKMSALEFIARMKKVSCSGWFSAIEWDSWNERPLISKGPFILS